jgi:hypothetical protein
LETEALETLNRQLVEAMTMFVEAEVEKAEEEVGLDKLPVTGKRPPLPLILYRRIAT